MSRTIIHVDMDAFFASVEQRDNPKLRGRPVIVGGDSRRGIVTTCSYEARKYGIHSAMPIFMARERCPHGIYVPVRMEKYKAVSKEILKILHSITDLVEPLSIDEAYLDISLLKQEPMRVVKYIKTKVMKDTGLTLSAGISYNKFLAKLASDWNKPNGVKLISQDMVPQILLPLPITKVYGIGEKSAKKLNAIGVFTIKDMMALSQKYLIEFLGKMGMDIYQMIRGVDHREVEAEREIKSIGRETTLMVDTKNKDQLKQILLNFSNDIANSLQKRNLSAKTLTIKMKEIDFTTKTRSKTSNVHFNKSEDIYIIAQEILDEILLKKKLRLIGLSLSNLERGEEKQLSFFQQIN